MTRRAAPVCGRLGQDQAFGTTDVCKLPAGHEGAHQGRYRDLQWEDVPGRPARANVTGRRIPSVRMDTDIRGSREDG